MKEILTAFEPALIYLLGLLITAAVGLAAKKMTELTGLEIEARHRIALTEALKSGAAASVKNGPDAGLEAVKRAAIAHAHGSAPKAIAKLRPTYQVLDTIAERYASEAQAGRGAGHD